jgi:hypothetical protein
VWDSRGSEAGLSRSISAILIVTRRRRVLLPPLVLARRVSRNTGLPVLHVGLSRSAASGARGPGLLRTAPRCDSLRQRAALT